MKTKPKKKTITAWAFAVPHQGLDGYHWIGIYRNRRMAASSRGYWPKGLAGPLTRVSLPLPKESKR